MRRVDVEILIDDISAHHLLVRIDETSKPIHLHREGIKVTMGEVPYATLNMTERRAINYNLI